MKQIIKKTRPENQYDRKLINYQLKLKNIEINIQFCFSLCLFYIHRDLVFDLINMNLI